MRLARMQFSLGRLMIVVTALGLNFGLVPWPACALTGAMLIPPLFLPSITLIDWGALYIAAAIFAWLLIGLSQPMITTCCRWGRVRTTRSRSSLVTWAHPVACGPTSTPGCSARTTR